MSDFAVADVGTGYDLVIVDGDLVLHAEDSLEDIAQRVIFELSTWLGESPYDPTAGVPYNGGVFGEAPIPGVVALLEQRILAVEGVAAILGSPDFVLDDQRVLTISATLVDKNGLKTEINFGVTP